MDFGLWPRVRRVYGDWGYRGLRGFLKARGLGLEVVAHPYAGVRGVWEGEEVPELPRVEGAKIRAVPVTRPLPKRWVVEQTFAPLGRNRRLREDFEQNPCASAAWLHLGMIRLLVKRLARAA